MVEGHLRAIRHSARYHNAYIFVFIEANYGGYWASSVLETIVQQKEFMPLEACSYDESDEEKVGVWMEPKLKPALAAQLQRSLADGQLVFAKDFITTQTEKSMNGKPKVQMDFMSQLSEYREELKEPNDAATGDYKKFITGKSCGRRDDMCICVQLALYFGMKRRMDDDFREIGESRGWVF
jgi:hypothetical protein